MSFVIAVTEAVGELAGIGSAITSANAAVAAPTTGIVAAAGDDVSAAVAAVFDSHGQGYQSLGAQIEKFHDRLVRALSSGTNSYVSAEVQNAWPMRELLGAVNAPAEALMGAPGSDGQSG